MPFASTRRADPADAATTPRAVHHAVALCAELLPDAEVIHFVDSGVLAQVGRDCGITEASTARMLHLAQAAEAAGVDAIFSVCSSLGPTMDTARRQLATPIIKIDDAMAPEAAAKGTRVGVLTTVPTTLGPTSDLIMEKAASIGPQVHIHQRLAEGAFDVLMFGDCDRHDQLVSAAAAELARDVDLVLLAQASMARLAPKAGWRDRCVLVVESPRLGVQNLAGRVRELDSV